MNDRRTYQKQVPFDIKYFFKKEGAGRQFFILGYEDDYNARHIKILIRNLTKSGCYVTLEDSYLTAREKVEKALKFHRLEVEDEQTNPTLSDTPS